MSECKVVTDEKVLVINDGVSKCKSNNSLKEDIDQIVKDGTKPSIMEHHERKRDLDIAYGDDEKKPGIIEHLEMKHELKEALKDKDK